MKTPLQSVLSRARLEFQNPRAVPRKLRKKVQNHFLGPLLSSYSRGSIVMFHVGRSGSKVLTDLIEQHPNLYWDGEIYERILPPWDAEQQDLEEYDLWIDHTRFLRKRMSRAGTRFYGFETKFFHLELTGIPLAEYVDLLRDLGFRHFIILERRNYLRVILSSIIAHEGGPFHITSSDNTEIRRVRIDTEDVRIDRDKKSLIGYMDGYREGFQMLEGLLQGEHVLRLSYEDDVLPDVRIGNKRICDFLGIDNRKVTVRFGRTNPFGLRDIIANFGEVNHAIQGSDYEWMLYD